MILINKLGIEQILLLIQGLFKIILALKRLLSSGKKVNHGFAVRLLDASFASIEFDEIVLEASGNIIN